MNQQLGANTYGEIYQQPQSLEAVYQSLPQMRAVLDKVFPQPDTYDCVVFTGCGTSFYLAQSAAHMFAAQTGQAAVAVPCSELYFFPEAHVAGRRVLVVPFTRKSVTTEVRMAIDQVRTFPGVTTLSVTCDPSSAAYNDYMLLSPDAAEKSVVMTRSFTSMLTIAAILALHVGKKEALLMRAAELPALLGENLPQMDALAKKMVAEHPDLALYVVLGQGELYGVANESMNKMKEMGLTNSEAYYSLEYRHGPMSLADDRTLILTLAHSACLDYDGRLLEQMHGLGAVTAAVGGDVSALSADYSLSLLDSTPLPDLLLAPVLAPIGQLLGYHIAMSKGLDADTPRNLTQAIVL